MAVIWSLSASLRFFSRLICSWSHSGDAASATICDVELPVLGPQPRQLLAELALVGSLHRPCRGPAGTAARTGFEVNIDTN